MSSYQRILVPVDFEGPSRSAARRALELGKLLNAEVRFVHIVDLRPHEFLAVGTYQGPVLPGPELAHAALERLDTFVRELGAFDTKRSQHVALGVPFEGILEEVGKWNPDLIVMGSKGRTGLSRFVLGSQAEMVVRRATVPVLVVHAEGADAAAKSG